MKVDIEKVKEILNRLREKGFTDEQIAIAIGKQMPGEVHPSSVSVYRWRAGRNKPGRAFSWAILELGKMDERSTK